ncbi:hypothetical protein [Ascidiaceihabitans sp.]|uniref:hypothetical protein n=1 Tax=Ascidiaceihabitans sp. TaxID=1872644 RepID=UPI003299F4BA
MSELKRTVPKEVMILHTPWIMHDGAFVGQIDDDHYIKCTYENELADRSPKVLDGFLSWSSEEPVFSDFEHPQWHKHYHDFTHAHDFGERALSAYVARLDKDNSGAASTAGAPHHTHRIELEEKSLGADSMDDRTDSPIIFEPRHQEVNAYFVPPTGGDTIGIPIGTIAFYNETSWSLNNWQAVGRYRQDAEPGEPNQWWNTFLKIVGCWPNQRSKGSNLHSHSGLEHHHQSGGAGAGKGGVRVDSSNDSFRVASPAHVHPIEADGIGPSTSQSSADADSRPYNLGLRAFVCVDDDAIWQVGMIVPFIPLTSSSYSNIPDHWELASRPGDTSHHLFLRCIDDPEVEEPGFLSEPMHTHEFFHGHLVKLGPSTGSVAEQSKSEISCAKNGHTHEAMLFDSEPVVSSAAPNILPNREVAFLRYIGP